MQKLLEITQPNIGPENKKAKKKITNSDIPAVHRSRKSSAQVSSLFSRSRSRYTAPLQRSAALRCPVLPSFAPIEIQFDLPLPPSQPEPKRKRGTPNLGDPLFLIFHGLRLPMD